MECPLTDFLIALADRPEAVSDAGLERAMTEAGLSEQHRRLLRGRDVGPIWDEALREIQAAGRADHGQAAATPARAPGRGELVVVGTGIKGVNDLSREAAGCIRAADRVLYVVADPATRRLIHQLNPGAEDLAALYDPRRPRLQTYQMMSARIVEQVRAGLRVCAVFYGHPGVFVKPSHLAIRAAREAGHRAQMVPAVSALDWLFADFNIDPSTHSCLIFGATDLLVCRRRIDPEATVIIYQAACVGDPGYHGGTFDGRNLPVLSEYLQTFYRPDHRVFIYEASQLALSGSRIERTTVASLPAARLTGASTLYLPPQATAARDPKMMERLGLPLPDDRTSATDPVVNQKENP